MFSNEISSGKLTSAPVSIRNLIELLQSVMKRRRLLLGIRPVALATVNDWPGSFPLECRGDDTSVLLLQSVGDTSIHRMTLVLKDWASDDG